MHVLSDSCGPPNLISLSCYAGIPVDWQRRTCTSVRPCGLYFAVVAQWICFLLLLLFSFLSLNVLDRHFCELSVCSCNFFCGAKMPWSISRLLSPSLVLFSLISNGRPGFPHCKVVVLRIVSQGCYLKHQFRMFDTLFSKINRLSNYQSNQRSKVN